MVAPSPEHHTQFGKEQGLICYFSVLLKKSTQECHCPILKLQSLVDKILNLLLCIFFTYVLSWELVISWGALLSHSLSSRGNIFFCTSRPGVILEHPSDFLLSFPQEKFPFSKMHIFTILLLLNTIFLFASKPPHLLAVLAPTSMSSPFLFLSYFHKVLHKAIVEMRQKKNVCPSTHLAKYPPIFWTKQ